MVIGFRNVDSQEMDGSPLFEIRPSHRGVEDALLEDRVDLKFQIDNEQNIRIVDVVSQRGTYSFDPSAFNLALKTATVERYWLDTGQFKPSTQYTEMEGGEDGGA
jgi:hypothetical protein